MWCFHNMCLIFLPVTQYYRLTGMAIIAERTCDWPSVEAAKCQGWQAHWLHEMFLYVNWRLELSAACRIVNCPIFGTCGTHGIVSYSYTHTHTHTHKQTNMMHSVEYFHKTIQTYRSWSLPGTISNRITHFQNKKFTKIQKKSPIYRTQNFYTTNTNVTQN